MILIPEFYTRVQPSLTGTHPVQQAFLHHLFPESVSFPIDKAEEISGAEGAANQKLALLGYWSLFSTHARPQFSETLLDFQQRELDDDRLILGDLATLLGITLGIRQQASKENRKWWRHQLGKWTHGFIQPPEQVEFCRLLIQGQVPAPEDLSEGYFVYLLLQSSQSMIGEGKYLKDFYVRTRKQKFPGPKADFHLTMLKLYGMDACFRRCIWEEAQVKALQREALAQVEAQIFKRAQQQGKWLALTMYAIGIPAISFCTYVFFRQLSANPKWAVGWELIGQALALFGGPIALLFILSRIVWEMIGKRPPSLKFRPVAQSIASFLLLRRLRRMGLRNA